MIDKDDEKFPIFPPVLAANILKALGKISTLVAGNLIDNKINQWTDGLDRETYSAITLALDMARRDRNNPISKRPEFVEEEDTYEITEQKLNTLLLTLEARGAFADNQIGPEDIEPEIFQKEQEARHVFDIILAAVTRSSNGMPSPATELEGYLDEAINWAKKEITFFDHNEDDIRKAISDKYAEDAVLLTKAAIQSTLIQKIITPPPQADGRAPQ